MSEQHQKYPSPELTQRLLTAADRGDVAKIKHLLSNDELYQSLKTEQQYFDFYSRLQDDFCGQTIFHVASSSGRADVLRLLLVSSTDENDDKNEDGTNNKQDVAIPKEFVEVKLLLLTAVDSDNWCPLHAAVINGHLDCIRVLLTMSSSNNNNNNIKIDDHGQRKIARAMLNVKGLGGTPLEVAQQHDNKKEILSFLKSVEKNTCVEDDDESSGNRNNKNGSTTDAPDVNGKDKDDDEEEFSSKMVIESQRAQLLQQQMQLQQLSMMFHQLQTENHELNLLYQKEKEEHKKTKEELEKMKKE